ncbi:Na(+)/H(+) antiporter subunit B [Fusibacter tunisiensis]|jgi:uncharacterized MnhB-related membrane protein|uniref:MnhB-related membrane protein n=1 Tax=Fusibacter tunisiensis TaxID=1008308 RepID=A0ABS2MS34_9FIRM|nr:DUF4040 domain-containing protein [Fusibacter tunisiensis]MBM7562216.1 putative MnhB-related membrane protein [Fusibacter tunisiensis]
MLELTLILLIILAIAAMQTRSMRNAVIYLGVFSLAISFVYLALNAPDVAIAEAVIGSTIATILYLVALQKYKIFTIYYRLQDAEIKDEHFYASYKMQLVKSLEKFCTKQELEAQIIYTHEQLADILIKHQYALIVEEHDDFFSIYAHHENYMLDKLEVFLEHEPPFKLPFRIIKLEEMESEVIE